MDFGVNGKRDKFIKMVRLCQALKIKSMENIIADKNVKFAIKVELHITKQKLFFVISKEYESKDEDIKTINADDIEWQSNVEWKDKNAYQTIVDALTPKQIDEKQTGLGYNYINLTVIVGSATKFSSQWLLNAKLLIQKQCIN